MSVDCLLDANVLVYAISAAEEDRTKKAQAIELILGTRFGLSAQVLQELYVTVTRKIRRPLSPAQAIALIEEYRSFPLIPVDYALIAAAVEFSVRYRISYWDGAILAAAAALGAPVLYSEDLNHGQVYGSVRVVNPFRDSEPAVSRS